MSRMTAVRLSAPFCSKRRVPRHLLSFGMRASTWNNYFWHAMLIRLHSDVPRYKDRNGGWWSCESAKCIAQTPCAGMRLRRVWIPRPISLPIQSPRPTWGFYCGPEQYSGVLLRIWKTRQAPLRQRFGLPLILDRLLHSECFLGCSRFINCLDVQGLQLVNKPKLGPARCLKIFEERQMRGAFTSADDLKGRMKFPADVPAESYDWDFAM